MPKTLEKIRKHIAKKRQGAIGAIHSGSRDAKKLHRAHVRDERLEKIAAARRKQEQPLIDRVTHFRRIVEEKGGGPLSREGVQIHIRSFVHQHDEELEAVKAARRPGRPPSTKEDLLKLRISTLHKEYQAGFLLPDLTTQENVALLDRWGGSWSYLTTLSWVRISDSGAVQPSSFPPKGDH